MKPRAQKTHTHRQKPEVGFIGQGYVGKNYADDFERRGIRAVRYSIEEPYRENKELISECKVVFIAVPTPTTTKGADCSIVREAIELVGEQKIAVIKSTIPPGTTKKLQKAYPRKTLLFSPEFLSEATAAQDVQNPFVSIIGVPTNSSSARKAAARVMKLLPKSPCEIVCDSTEAEIIKYTHNGSGYVQIVFFNLMYDIARAFGASWNPIRTAIAADPLISNRYADPVHKSGRGAGGNCFIKDFAALRDLYDVRVADSLGKRLFRAIERKNLSYLAMTNKDADLVASTYGNKRQKIKKRKRS